VPVTAYRALATVPGLRKGRIKARETAPIKPVADDVVNATLNRLGTVVADMVSQSIGIGPAPFDQG
jgi:hypothetical protein